MPSPITVPFFNTANLNPGVYIGVTNANANTASSNQNTLIIGQMATAGNAVAGVPVLSQGATQDGIAFGVGSPLYNMIQVYRKRDPQGSLYVLPVVDNPAGIASVQTLTFATNATSSGTLPLYVAGQQVFVPVISGATPTTIGTSVAAAINANTTLPVTASASTGVVTITNKNKGVTVGDVDVRLAYNNEVGITGTTLVVATTTAGATDPDLATPLTNLTDLNADFIYNPFSSTSGTQIGQVSTFLSDASGRWNPTVMLFGHQFTAIRGSSGTAISYVSGHNDQHLSVFPVDGTPEPIYLAGADLAAAVAVSIREDPGLPVQKIVTNVMAPPISSRYTFDQRNTMLGAGLSTTIVDTSGTVYIDRVTTTYTTAAGTNVADNSYRDVETMYSLMDITRFLLSYLTSKYGRKKLIDDGNTVQFGQNIVTPGIVKNDLVAQYIGLVNDGRAQNADYFKTNVQMYNDGNGDLFVYLPVTLVNQLREIVGLVAFQKT